MIARRALGTLASFSLVACGGAEARRLPDETGDFVGAPAEPERGEAYYAGTTPGGPDLGGTAWRWVEAHCTEGPLDLAARGFAQELRVTTVADGLLLTYDQTTASDACTLTVVQHAVTTDDPREWRMVEEVRVAMPPADGCYGRMEQPRPGEVRRAGEFLEVLVQRSNWCGGFEVRMVYAPAPPAPLTTDALVRHYIAHFNRRDPEALGRLFADASSLLEPFTVSETGGGTRHEGRDAVRTWYAQAFEGVPWVALRLEEIAAGEAEGKVVASWRYMDPRVEEPFAGKSLFTVAAGEIYEAEIRLDAPPAPPTPPRPAAGRRASPER